MFKRVRNKFLRLSLLVIYLVILFTCAVQINFLGLFGASPTKKQILLPELNISSELYTADSVLIARYYKQDRDPVSFDSISPNVINALIATEDVRFFKHQGVDVIGLFSGMLSTLSGSDRGGSTITQQLAKNLYKTRYKDSQGLLGKVPGLGLLVTKYKEWMTAFKLESKYSKKEILTMYLNTVSFSNNAYGIKSAATRYFDKSPKELSVKEAAVLVGMLKGTTLYNPIRNPEKSLERRNVVLGQMKKEGFIKDEELTQWKADSLALNLNNHEEESSNDSYLRAAVEKWLEKWSDENEMDIYTSGLKIYTTIDSRMQKIAEEKVYQKMKDLQSTLDRVWGDDLPWRDKAGNVIPDFLENHARKLPIYTSLMQKLNNEELVFEELNKKKEMSVFTWDGMEEVNYSTMDSLRHYITMLNTGMMAMNPKNGEIKVWVGGINHNYYKFDHVNQAKRQAGSTFKPFAYAAALESGMAPCDKYEDKPVSVEFINNKGVKEVWEPKNADWTFSHNQLSLRHAMARSLNSVTAQVTRDVGWDKVVEMANKCGIDSKLESVPSVGLGSNDVSVFEMVRGYATFMNEGKRTEPVLVSRIEDKNGKVLAEFKTETKQALSVQDAWLMSYMLRGTVEEPGGTSQALWEWDLFDDQNQIGGKTGTSSDYVDGWYMGVTKDLVAGVWVGCDEQSIHFKSSATGEGSKTALPIYAMFMEELYKNPELGVTLGQFPEATVEITKNINCPSPRIRTTPDSVVQEGVRENVELPSLVLPRLEQSQQQSEDVNE